MPSGASASIAAVSSDARPRPAPPPIAASTPASTSHCRAITDGEAPIASWIACARRACATRVSISPDTLTQATSSSTTTAPSNTHSA
jgi:hypothetical protein